jgi:hypothetical protein
MKPPVAGVSEVGYAAGSSGSRIHWGNQEPQLGKPNRLELMC